MTVDFQIELIQLNIPFNYFSLPRSLGINTLAVLFLSSLVVMGIYLYFYLKCKYSPKFNSSKNRQEFNGVS